MQFLYFLEGLRTPLLDGFFSAITYLGSEMLFIVIAVVVYWCFSKRWGLYMLLVGFFGTVLNQTLKLLCKVPRPWVRDPNFTIVESARADAGGYSFPSGHTASIVSTLGSAARINKKVWVRVVSLVLIALTALSRMYLGVHTPADVLFSLAAGAVLIFVLYPLFADDRHQRGANIAVALVPIVTFLNVLFVEIYPWSPDMDPENLAEGIKNAYSLFGCGVGLAIALPLEKKFVNFDVHAPLWGQVLKIVLGCGLLLGIRGVLKPLFAVLFGGGHVADSVRYGIIVVFAVYVWPQTFRWFAAGCPLKKQAKAQ